MTKCDSKPRARFLPAIARAIATLFLLAEITGCLVRFDGYTLGNAGAGVGGHDSDGDSSGAANAAKGGAAGGPSAGSGSPGIVLTEGTAGATGRAGHGNAGAPNGAGNGNAGGVAGAANAGSGNTNTGGSLTGGAGAIGTSGSSTAGGSGAGQLTCPETHNRISVAIPLPGGDFYCIDRAEVKNVEYKAFLDAQTSTSGQASLCAFNVSYEPDMANGCTQYDPVGKQNQPIACVDWCDAAAYCKWEGKHLCGKIGGGKNPQAGFADANLSAWYRACSHAGDNDLPYGNVYDGMRCIGLENTAVRPVAVPNTNCEGGYSGLYDMSGNVSEWEDSCSADSGGSDLCLYRGGSYLDTNRQIALAPSLQCNSNVHGAPLMAAKPRSTRDKEIGFRCCSEPIP